MLSPTPAPLGSRRRVFGAQHRSTTDVSTIRFCLPATRPPEGAYGAGRPHAPGRRGHPHPTQCSELPTGSVAPGHRGENAQAPEHRGDARARQPGPGLRGCRLGGGARGERGGAARYRPRPSPGGRGGAAGAARKRSAARAGNRRGVGVRAAGPSLDRGARTLGRVRALLRRHGGVPPRGRRRDRRQHRHGRHARGERPRSGGRGDALLYPTLRQSRRSRRPRPAPAHRRPRHALELGPRRPAARDARGERVGRVPRSRSGGTAADAAGARGAVVRERRVRGESCRAARRAAPGDPRREGGRPHRRSGLDPVTDRPMTTATSPATGPVSRIDPEAAYRRPTAPGSALLRLDSNEGVLPPRELLAGLAGADPELLRRYPEVSELEAALAARLAVAPELVIDHVYVEYADEDLTPGVLTLPNALVLRTFSKAWGLAGCRVGYAVGSPYVIGVLRAAGGPYSVAAPSIALALAQLERGEGALRAHVARIRTERGLLTARLAAAGGGLAPQPSQAHFALVECGGRAQPIRAALAERGGVVRDFPGRPGLETSLRITLPGTPTDFERLCAALDAALAAVGSRP